MTAQEGARLGRGSFTLFSFAEALLAISAAMFLFTISALMAGSQYVELLISILLLVIVSASMVANIHLTIKRFHDLGKSGWHYLLLTLVNI